MTLYELTGEYLQLLALAEDPDTDPQVLADTLEGLGGEIEVKADGYAKVIRQLESDSAGLKAEIDRLTARKRAIDNSIDRMKESLKNAMIWCEKPKFKTELFSFGIQKNAPSVVLDVTDVTAIPEEYLIAQDPKIDKMKMKDDLKAGKVLDGIAHLEQSESLRIR